MMLPFPMKILFSTIPNDVANDTMNRIASKP